LDNKKKEKKKRTMMMMMDNKINERGKLCDGGGGVQKW